MEWAGQRGAAESWELQSEKGQWTEGCTVWISNRRALPMLFCDLGQRPFPSLDLSLLICEMGRAQGGTGVGYPWGS